MVATQGTGHQAVNRGDVESISEGDLDAVVPVVTQLARAYTRGQGFNFTEPNRDIAAVICTASARLAANGKQYHRQRVDDVEIVGDGGFGWSLAERAVLNRYRVTAL